MPGPPISVASGSQNATLTTVHTLATLTTPGTYICDVDTAAMTWGEVLTLVAKVKARAGDASTVFASAIYKHVQAVPHKLSLPVPVAAEVVFTLRQDGGTGRAYPFNILDLVHSV